jgi:hypothetical protein
MHPRLAWLLVPALFTGCIYATFVPTDVTFAPHAAPEPAVYVDRLPPFGYRPVGIIEVTASASTSLGDVMATAARKGAEVGCDVVVERSIHRVVDARPVPTVYWLAQHHVYVPPPVHHAPVYYAPPPSKREFVCGVAVEQAAVRSAASGI